LQKNEAAKGGNNKTSGSYIYFYFCSASDNRIFRKACAFVATGWHHNSLCRRYP